MGEKRLEEKQETRKQFHERRKAGRARDDVYTNVESQSQLKVIYLFFTKIISNFSD